ncbi:Expansin [Gossypium australe]|uniref:Expansin n=1 Tax=Gossypium australe TaxID=47621 RepID=A0A5B6VL68_9ROSI|nr:Expansin [Gossypium australe]
MEIAYLFITALFLVGLFSTQTDAAATWLSAHATFYGGSDASGTMGGACGYGNLYTDGYGTKTAALSTALFNDGKSWEGAIRYFVMLKKHLNGVSKVDTLPSLLPTPVLPIMHSQVTMVVGVILPVRISTCLNLHSRPLPNTRLELVKCERSGVLRFTINGRNYFELVLISNVGGAGEISKVWIKGSKTNKWETMSRNWGANWQSLSYLNGQSLSFRVQVSNERVRTTLNVVPSNWEFGQSFKSNIQF